MSVEQDGGVRFYTAQWDNDPDSYSPHLTKSMPIGCRYDEQGNLKLLLNLPIDTCITPDLRVTMPLPTLLTSDPVRRMTPVVVTGSKVYKPQSPEDILWSSGINTRLGIMLDKDLTIGGLGRQLQNRDQAPYTLLYIPSMASVHTNFIELRHTISLGPGVVLDTHQQTLEVDKEVVPCPNMKILRLIGVLAATKYVVSIDKISSASKGVSEATVRKYVKLAREFIHENLPKSYSIASVEPRRYKLVRPEAP